MTTVTLIHPHADLLANIGEVHAAVHAGQWGIAADLCADKALDLSGQRDALNQYAATSGLPFTTDDDEPRIVAHVTGPDTLTLDGELPEIRAALDLYMRLLCGQWLELARMLGAPPRTRRRTSDDTDDLLHIRQRYGRVADDTLTNRRRHPLADNEWPSHPSAYISIASAPLAARVGYHLYKDLEGGASPTFPLPGGPVRVHVGPRLPIHATASKDW